ncbi:hypothetical protein CSE45_4861 [Citreicella sp. SE45]|nr:hypothetical protein CSE45_4861 [Citreicella sp. SE45]
MRIATGHAASFSLAGRVSEGVRLFHFWYSTLFWVSIIK